MKKRYICRNCKKTDEFETDETPSLLVEKKEVRSEPEVYIVNCSHCGEENRVEVFR